MTEEQTHPESTAQNLPTEPNPNSSALVKLEMPEANEDEVKETAALFDALKKRISAQLENVGNITREVYQRIVNQEIESLKKNKTIAQEKLDTAVKLIKQETEKNWTVIDAIKSRALAQVHQAGNVTRSAYLEAVTKARKALEDNPLIEKERLDEAVHQIQSQAEKNWQSITEDLESLGHRLQDTAKNAWSTLKSAFRKKGKIEDEDDDDQSGI